MTRSSFTVSVFLLTLLSDITAKHDTFQNECHAFKKDIINYEDKYSQDL